MNTKRVLNLCEDDIVCDDEDDILMFVMTRMIFAVTDSICSEVRGCVP